MNRFLIILTLTILVPFGNIKSFSQTKTNSIKEKITIEEKLKNHFDLYRIKPSIEINNTEDNQTEIKLGNHTIKWLNTNNETKIKIDKDLFTLKDNITLNIVWDDKDNVDFANNWDQIKLYKHNDKEYIGIRMSFSPCTGLGCSIDYYLIYDVATKTQNYFGTFRTNREMELFEFNNDNKIDFVSKTYIGQSDGVATEVYNLYEVYSMEKNGKFIQKFDNQKKPYFIKRTFNSDGDELDEKFKMNWIVKII